MMARYSKCLLLVLALFVGSAAQAADEAEEGAPAPGFLAGTQYIDIKPAFVTNYGGVGRLRFLKTEITLRVGGGAVGPNSVRHHMPRIRHEIVMLLSRQTVDDISSMEGRELLRQNALKAVQEALLKEDGQQFVVDLLFKTFIVQG